MNPAFLFRCFLFVYLNICAGSIAFVAAWHDVAGRDQLASFLTSWATFFMAMIVVAETALGILHLLTIPALALLFGAAASVSWFVFWKSGSRLALAPGWRVSGERLREALRDGPISITLALVVVLAGSLTITALVEPSTLWDSYAYHLNMAVDWMQHGAIERTYLAFADIPISYYPGTTELLYFWVLAPFRNDVLVRLIPVAMWLLTALGLWQVSRQCGARRIASSISVIVFLFAPVVLSQATELWTDLAQATFFVLALARLFEYARRPSLGRAALFGLAGGLLLGSKYSGPAFLLFLLAAYGLVGWSLRRSLSLASQLRSLFVIALAVTVTGGFWYVRNLIDTGSPIYPVPLTLFGIQIFSGPGTSTSSIWNSVRAIRTPDMAVSLEKGYGAFYFLAAAIGLVAAARWLRPLAERGNRPEHSPQHGWLTLVGGLFAGTLLMYLHTPYSAWRASPDALVTTLALNGGMRYSLVAGACGTILIAAGLTAALRYARTPWLLAAGAAVTGCLAGSDKQSFDFFPSRIFTFPRVTLMGVIVVAGILVLPSLRRVRWPQAPAGNLWHPRTYLALAALPVLVVVSLGLNGLVSYRERYRYPVYVSAFGDIAQLWRWIDDNIHGARIAFAGDSRPGGAYGREFNNEVRYINVTGTLDQRYDDFHPSGWGYRLNASYEAWRKNLTQWSAEYVVIAGAKLPEAKWAGAHPELFVPLLQNGNYRVYRLRLPPSRVASVP